MPLSPRQQRFYHQRADLWRQTLNPAGPDGKFTGRTWSRVAEAVPCHIVIRGGPMEPAGGLLRAEGQDLITTDKLHFSLDVHLEVDDEIQVLGGHSAGKWWKLVENPEIREWRANKQEVIGVRIETPSSGAGA